MASGVGKIAIGRIRRPLDTSFPVVVAEMGGEVEFPAALNEVNVTFTLSNCLRVALSRCGVQVGD